MKAKVIEKKNGRVTLELIHEEAGCRDCGICLIGRKKTGGTISIRSAEPVEPSDIVRVEYSEKRGILMAGFLFFLPTLIFFFSLMLLIRLDFSEVLSLMIALTELVLYYLLLGKLGISGIKIVKIP